MPTIVLTHLREAVNFLQNGITEAPHNPDDWDITINLNAHLNGDAVAHALVRAFLYISPIQQIKKRLGHTIHHKILPHRLKILLNHTIRTDSGMQALGNLLKTHTHLPNGLHIEALSRNGIPNSVYLAEALCQNPKLPENLYLKFANFRSLDNYMNIADQFSKASTKLPKGFTLDVSRLLPTRHLLHLISGLFQNPNLPEQLTIDVGGVANEYIGTFTALILEGMQSGRIKAGTRILGVSPAIDELCRANDMRRAQYWYPREGNFNQPEFVEPNKTKAATTFVGGVLATHHKWIYASVDDMKCDVLSFGQNDLSI